MRVLQIGRDDWSVSAQLPQGVDWVFVGVDDAFGFEPALIGRPDVTILDAPCDLGHLTGIDAAITPHTLLVDERLQDAGRDEAYRLFLARKVAASVDVTDRQRLVDELPRQYFARQFGQKLEVRRAIVSPFHRSGAQYEGNSYLVTEIDRDEEFRQLVMWKENIPYESAHALELWPEFVVDPSCEIEFHVQLIQSGTADVIAFQRSYSQAELAEPITFDEPTSGYLSCSIFARGKGVIKAGPIHYRHSRHGAGQFLPGGQRIVDSRREEIFHYFHPGNLQPPFNIYFAGYRPAEGFEGFYMMAGLRQPFLLISDPRLEGGRFYLGSEELEAKLVEVIRDRIHDLGFTEQDVIFSGLSMGSFGALYYGSQFDAHAIIAGKPIVDLGYLAERGRLVRPNDFFTIFDIVNFWDINTRTADDSRDQGTVGGFTEALVERWRGEPGFGDTRILLSYMEQDDYDDEAYFTLLRSQTGKTTTVIARGYHGRHNDDSPSIVTWFSNQYRRVIDEYERSRHAE